MTEPRSNLHDRPRGSPRGVALIAVLVPALAWRWHRPLFPWLAALGSGIVLATVYLRFHYMADVLAAFLLAPLAWRLGTAIHQRFRCEDRAAPVDTTSMRDL